MRKKALCVACALVVSLGGITSAQAFQDGSGEAMVGDFLVVRPACLVATIIGSAFFVLSLPVAAISKSTDKTAETLVAVPARATFTRPLGKLSALQ
jgi:hypothetical protein